MRGDKVVAFLEDRLEEGIPLSAEELADVLCQLRTVSFRPTRQTMAHRLLSGQRLPACPVFINTKPQPDGPLSSRTLELLGGHLALAFRDVARKNDFVVAGVPGTGKLLADGFCRYWSSQNDRSTECLVLARRPKQFGFYLSRRRPVSIQTDYAVIIDNVSLTGGSGCSAARALMNAGYARVDCLFLVDREEGASEAFRAINASPIAHVTLKTIIRRAIALDRVRAETIWPRLEGFQNALRSQVGLSSVTLP